MDLVESMRAFRQVIDSNGFAAAARSMNLTRSTVSKQVAALENEIGAQLLIRSTRTISATDVGQVFYDRCVAILEDIDEAISAVGQIEGTPSGRLRINAPMTFGTMYVNAAVVEFMSLYPDVVIELALNDRFVDPIEEGFDVTIRVSEPSAATSLIHRPISTSRRVICASPRYLKANGAPEHPQELQRHRCLNYGYHTTGSVWRFAGPDGEQSVPISCAMWSNNGEALREAACRDQGVTILPDFIIRGALESGELVELLDPYRPLDVVVHAIYPRHRHLSPKVRLFVDFLADRFRNETQMMT